MCVCASCCGHCCPFHAADPPSILYPSLPLNYEWQCIVYPGTSRLVEIDEETCEDDVFVGNLVVLLLFCCCGCCTACVCCYYGFVHKPHQNRMRAAAASVQDVTAAPRYNDGTYSTAGAPPAYDSPDAGRGQVSDPIDSAPPYVPQYSPQFSPQPTQRSLSEEDDVPLIS